MHKPYAIDERREILIPGDQGETLDYAVTHWIAAAERAIREKGRFFVALSGGSTPKKIFQALSSKEYRDQVEWSNVFLFWSDERSVPPDHPDSNYHMALVEGGLNTLPIPIEHIFRMHAEEEIEKNALGYELTIKKQLGGRPFDLIMLGMGDDGHTASLFPHTKALLETKRLVVANHVPQKNSWRLSFTYTLINQAKEICLYVMGENKREMLEKVLTGPFNKEEHPSQNVGTKEHKALWIADTAAGHHLLARMS